MSAVERSASRRAARTALTVTVVLTAAKVAVWVATGSLAVLSQAVDSALDIVALTLVVYAVRLAARPADVTHHYGHAKAENLVAFAQTLLLGLLSLGIAVEALSRLSGGGHEVEAPSYALALFAVSAGVDVWRAVTLQRAARHEGSEALRAGALNIATDVGTAVVTLVALVATRAGLGRADAIGGLTVATAVAVAAVRLGRRSVDVLMDRAPSRRADAIQAAVERTAGVAETRRVRVRGTGDQLFADVTVAAGRTASLERVHDIAEAIEREIEEAVPGTDVVVHVEPAAEGSGLVERVHAAASRDPAVQEIHNVQVHALSGSDHHLHVTFHAKVPGNMPLSEAHEVADRLEAAVAGELGPGTRVDSHIEPMKRTAPGKDVTADRNDVVRTVQTAARSEPEVLDCHEIVVTSGPDGLLVMAHVRGRSDLPLLRIHDASERIENAVHASHPDVGDVVIHFEPA